MCGLIVEGVGRQTASSQEFARYLTMAIGSGEEARLWCRYALDLEYVEAKTAEEWREQYGQILRTVDEAARERPSFIPITDYRQLITER